MQYGIREGIDHILFIGVKDLDGVLAGLEKEGCEGMDTQVRIRIGGTYSTQSVEETILKGGDLVSGAQVPEEMT